MAVPPGPQRSLGAVWLQVRFQRSPGPGVSSIDSPRNSGDPSEGWWGQIYSEGRSLCNKRGGVDRASQRGASKLEMMERSGCFLGVKKGIDDAHSDKPTFPQGQAGAHPSASARDDRTCWGMESGVFFLCLDVKSVLHFFSQTQD